MPAKSHATEVDRWDTEVSTIQLVSEYGPESLQGLADFSHLEVVYQKRDRWLAHLGDRGYDFLLSQVWRSIVVDSTGTLMNEEEQKVRDFYDHYGWVVKAGVSGEDTLFRDFSPPYYPYHDRVNARTMDCFADLAGRLLIAGGGDLPETHVKIARKFSETTCLDISKVAIEIARNKLENRGEFIVGSILDIPKPEDHFDAVYCPHVVYHIDRDYQDKAVRELIRVTRPGGRVVVIYANPDSVPSRVARLRRDLSLLLHKVKRQKTHARPGGGNQPPLYYFAHPLAWWSQFHDQCDVKLKPWDVMGNAQEKAILINDRIASFGYKFCAWFEDRYPDSAARWWSYPLIVLTKKTVQQSTH